MIVISPWGWPRRSPAELMPCWGWPERSARSSRPRRRRLTPSSQPSDAQPDETIDAPPDAEARRRCRSYGRRTRPSISSNGFGNQARRVKRDKKINDRRKAGGGAAASGAVETIDTPPQEDAQMDELNRRKRDLDEVQEPSRICGATRQSNALECGGAGGFVVAGRCCLRLTRRRRVHATEMVRFSENEAIGWNDRRRGRDAAGRGRAAAGRGRAAAG